VLVSILVVIVALLALRLWTSTSQSPAARQVQQITKQEHKLTINSSPVLVKPLSFSFIKFQIPSDATSVTLQGNFTATGGTGNDIEAYVLSEADFVNWQNGHDAKTYYNSGKVTVGTINVNLPAGTCYLVFNNKFSVLSSKSVKIEGAADYYE